MAKQRTKRAAFETLCTQVSPGIWQWETQAFEWEYREGPGINLFQTVRSAAKPVAFFKSLDHAVCFTHGWTAGFNAAPR